MFRTARTWLSNHPFTVFYTLACVLLIGSTLVPGVAPAYWIGAMFGFVVCPLLRLLLNERIVRVQAEKDRDTLSKGMEDITAKLREGVERVQSAA